MTLSDLFPRPPFQPPARTERRCEQLMVDMLREKFGEVCFPAPTDVLTCLIERDAKELDLYADLTSRDGNPEGVTDFEVGVSPTVLVSERLSDGPNENRLRTTLAHEYGHVVLHDPLVQSLGGPRLLEIEGKKVHTSNRATPEGEPKGDLIEYQAWYFCGALLMPKSYVTRLVSDAMEGAGLFSKQYQHSGFGLAVRAEVALAFGVSQEAARIRLLKLGLLSEAEPAAALF